MFFLPADVGPYIGVIAQIGVILYMFLVGLELNPAMLWERAGTAFAISHASIAVPFVFGAALGLYLYPRLSEGAVPFTSFALARAVAGRKPAAGVVRSRCHQAAGVLRGDLDPLDFSPQGEGR